MSPSTNIPCLCTPSIARRTTRKCHTLAEVTLCDHWPLSDLAFLTVEKLHFLGLILGFWTDRPYRELQGAWWHMIVCRCQLFQPLSFCLIYMLNYDTIQDIIVISSSSTAHLTYIPIRVHHKVVTWRHRNTWGMVAHSSQRRLLFSFFF